LVLAVSDASVQLAAGAARAQLGSAAFRFSRTYRIMNRPGCSSVRLRRYAIFVAALEAASSDNLDWIKEKALKAAFELLAAKPEAEARLLRLLVNKLGDPNRKVASKAGYLLSCLLTRHPLMGAVVVREVERFLFRCVLL
jgi:hypothetical protein